MGVTAGTIRAGLTRSRWPDPDDTTGGANRWTGATATQALVGRRGYRRSAEGPRDNVGSPCWAELHSRRTADSGVASKAWAALAG